MVSLNLPPLHLLSHSLALAHVCEGPVKALEESVWVIVFGYACVCVYVICVYVCACGECAVCTRTVLRFAVSNLRIGSKYNFLVLHLLAQFVFLHSEITLSKCVLTSVKREKCDRQVPKFQLSPKLQKMMKIPCWLHVFKNGNKRLKSLHLRTLHSHAHT